MAEQLGVNPCVVAVLLESCKVQRECSKIVPPAQLSYVSCTSMSTVDVPKAGVADGAIGAMTHLALTSIFHW